jgi:signal peptidase I
MVPFIRNGDTITLAPISGNLRVGDVVAALKENEGLVVHRIIRILPDRVMLRGDNHVIPDPPLPISGIIGRVIMIERNSVKMTVPQSGLRSYTVALLSRAGLLRGFTGLVRRIRRRLDIESY